VAFLVAALQQHVLGQGHPQADDIFQFPDELRVARDPGAAHAMRL
jgi:hypothetical protein